MRGQLRFDSKGSPRVLLGRGRASIALERTAGRWRAGVAATGMIRCRSLLSELETVNPPS
jgi:hypothetical protein